jgi:hypothetical protein
VNQQRYHAFRTARVMIATLPLDAAQQGVLFDAAEGMLLARDAGDDAVTECATDASWILRIGLAAEQLDAVEARQIARLIERCGPELELDGQKNESCHAHDPKRVGVD